MGRTLIERRLRDVTERLKTLRQDLVVAEEQLSHFAEEADEARLRSLVSETPGAEQTSYEAQRHAEAMRRHRDGVQAEITHLESAQNDLLDRFVAASA